MGLPDQTDAFSLSRMVALKTLLQDLPQAILLGDAQAQVTQIVLDSRLIEPGSLFVALKGLNTDGHRYIPDAIQRGAGAILGSEPNLQLPVPYILVKDSREALAHLAASFYGYPARQLMVIGVTGTDGKTTTAMLIYHILRAADMKAGMITTVNAVIGEQVLDTGFHVTTPEAPTIQEYLARMVSAGITHVVLEATSHGLAQHRVTACDFDIGVVTNITHEHLDYHGSYEAYREAKASLFKGLESSAAKSSNPPRGAVLNRDDKSYEYLASSTKVQQLTYGLTPLAHFQAKKIRADLDGIRFNISISGQASRLLAEEFEPEFYSSLSGAYNVSNCLAAIAATSGFMGIGIETIKSGMSMLTSVPGRMEKIASGQLFTAIVDFAHTPNALFNALKSARDFAEKEGKHGRIIVVFGSAGLRDRLKRRMMAEVAGELADLTVLTAEDPRTESLPTILADMAEGIKSKGAVEGITYWRIPDRREAIRFAVRQARPGDVVIAFGKGHEQSMCFEEDEYPWDDRVAVRAAIAELLNVPGPVMPYLPAVE